jgi:autoinducer 2-degrading protein
MSYTSLILLSLTIAVNGFSMQMASSTSTKPYGVNVKLSIKPERREDFLTIVRKNQKQTLDLEPAALQYVVGEDVDSPNTFYIHEQFTGAEGFDAHRATPHNGEWAKFKESEPFADGGDPAIDFYYGDHEPEEVPIRPAFCLNVELCIKPEIREEFLEVIRNNEKGSNGKEPLCLQYVWGESTEEDNKFLFHEEYTGEDGGKEGFDAHTKAPHFKKWEEFVEKDPFTKEPVVYFFRTI